MGNAQHMPEGMARKAGLGLLPALLVTQLIFNPVAVSFQRHLLPPSTKAWVALFQFHSRADQFG
jgi:hypothetical protein